MNWTIETVNVLYIMDHCLIYIYNTKYGFLSTMAFHTFLATSVEYLGHVIDDKGLHTSPNKVAAIQNAPAPTNQQQLCSLLGFLHYYGKFIPNLAMLLHSMNQLLKSGSAWKWLSQCQQAF